MSMDRETFMGDDRDWAHKQSLRTDAQPVKAPHAPAAFINCIAERGTKQEAVVYLQQTWNELQQALQKIAELTPDAAKWRALRDCDRITSMGSAGLWEGSPDLLKPYGHVTLNLWTGAPDQRQFSKTCDQDKHGRQMLDVFITKAVANAKG